MNASVGQLLLKGQSKEERKQELMCRTDPQELVSISRQDFPKHVDNMKTLQEIGLRNVPQV
jgi:hypothetical protein